jgi:two-component system, chemotaxis family, protein-glutamate methylesterase/glutaminase
VIKVLVVDDSALVRKLFGRVLSGEADFEMCFARDGIEALDQLKLFRPDVVTLDIHMPQMDGLACLDRIMVERPCPVVMVSTLTAEGAETTLEALRLGAVDFVPKPEGAVSLHIDVFAPQLVAKIRAAATVKLKASLRLRERIQHRMGGVRPSRMQTGNGAKQAAGERASGMGLVLVGTSTGGPSALEALLVPLPAGFPWPIVIAQHMPASFTGPLSRRLDKLCAVTVTELVRSTVLESGNAYIGRGDADIVVSRRDANFVAAPVKAEDYPWHPSTDRLVRSALNYVPPGQIIGILMTGMGDDGAAAMTRLRALGGRTIAEAEETAAVWGMPGELVKAGGADWVVPLPRIAEKLQQLVPLDASDPKRA